MQLTAEGIAKQLSRNGKVQRTPGGWLCHCPAHDDREPSLNIGEKNGKLVWKCYTGCDQMSVWQAMVQKIPALGKDIPMASSSSRHTTHTTTVPPVPPSALPDKARQWLLGRGISDEAITTMQIGWDDERVGVAFPYYAHGVLEYVKVRKRQPKESGRPDWWQTPGGGYTYYGIDNIDPETTTVYITEGEVDALSLMTIGIWDTVSVPNGAGVTDSNEHPAFVASSADLFRQFDKIVLAVDGDEKGAQLRDRLAMIYGKDKCWIVTWPDGIKDANELLQRHGQDALRRVLDAAAPYPIRELQTAREYVNDVFDLYHHGKQRGLSTGYQSVDEYYTVMPGELEVVTGIPSSGKTNWLDQICCNLSEIHGTKHAVCSFENPMAQHLGILAEKRSRRSFVGYGGVRISEAELEDALSWIDQHFVFIRFDDEDAPTVDAILKHARAAKLRYGISTLVVDPWNYIEQARRRDQTETEYTSEVLSKLRRFAQMHDVHVWLVAHPPKMQRDKDGQINPPTGYDISGCYAQGTEVLTTTGWVRHEDVTLDHTVACFNPATGSLEYHKPEVLHVYDHAGLMHHYTGYGMDMLVTPNHRMVVKPLWSTNNAGKSATMGAPRKWSHDEWQFVESQALTNSQFWVPNASCDPVAGQRVGFSELDGGYDDDEAVFRLMGWYVAEGHHSSGSIGVCQRWNEHARVKDVLCRLNLDFKDTVQIPKRDELTMWSARVYKRSHPQLVEAILSWSGTDGAAHKRLPDFVFTASVPQREALLEALLEGDGSRKRNGFSYSTTSPVLADQVQRLCIDLGYKADVRALGRAMEHHKDRYAVNINRRDRKERTLVPSYQRSEVPYQGKVYCLTVPTGAYVTRRNGTSAICGNSAHFYNKADVLTVVHRNPTVAPQQVDIIWRKCRFKMTGKPGQVQMRYSLSTGCYEEPC